MGVFFQSMASTKELDKNNEATEIKAIIFGIFFLLKKTLGIRVSETDERRGLDIAEHGMESYAGFQIFLNQ